LAAVVPEIGPADARQGHPDDRVGRLHDHRVRQLADADVVRSVEDGGSHDHASSMSSVMKRSRFRAMSAWRSATFCSVEPIESAPAMNRRRGGSSLATVSRARANFAGSPDCLPFWLVQYSICPALRSS